MSSRRHHMSHLVSRQRVLGSCVVVLLSVVNVGAAGSELADAAMKRNRDAVRSLLQRKADVNAPQIDGTTALHWAVRSDDLETADLLIRAGANVSAANRAGATPMQLAALNGNAAMIDNADQGRSRPECPADPIWRHGAHDGVAHREDRRHQGAAGQRREGQREGNLGRHDRLDVGRVRAPSGGRQDADRPRRGRQCPFEFRARRQRPRL